MNHKSFTPRSVLSFGVLGASLLALGGCDSLKNALSVSVTGDIEIDGDAPEAYDLTLYAYTDNTGAFDESYCGDDVGADCLGRVKVGQLNTPVQTGEVTWEGNSFTITEVPADLLYVLVATGDDASVVCSTDVVGFDEQTKVVTQDSAITIGSDEGLDTFALPRSVQLQCSAPATEPAPPDNDDGGDTDGDIPEGDDPGATWESFLITDKQGTTLADASAGNAVAEVSCGSDFPPVLEVSAVATDTEATEAWLRIQLGSGDSATYRTTRVPIANGSIEQSFSLSGGYAVVQLDFDEDLGNGSESYTVTFCDQDDPPAQQMLTILTWDKDDTDVDTHIYADGQEVAYYSMSQSWGDLDIDDVNGYGPETFTSTPDADENLVYDVKVHYYSDHGNGDTTATMRVVYYDASSGEVCDVTTSRSLTSYSWWDVGAFGPDMTCPE